MRPLGAAAEDAEARARDGEAMDGGAVERTIRVLREGIETGAFAPGQRLVEPDLTRTLGVSRSSLREAFRRLSAESVVEIVPYRGAVVRRFSARDIREIQQIRRVLEPLAASLAAATIGQPGNRARFDKVAAIWLHSPPLDDLDTFSRENRRFHRIIVELSGNGHLATMIERLNMPLFAAHFRRRITPERRIAAAAQHREIALAIRDGDRRAAQRAMKGHVGHSDRIVLPGDIDAFATADAPDAPAPDTPVPGGNGAARPARDLGTGRKA